MSIGESIRAGFRRATRWRLLLLLALLSALPAALATLPIWQFLAGALDHAPRAALLAAGMEASWLPDLAQLAAEKGAGAGIQGGLLSALVVALLLGPVMAGATLAEAGSDHPLRLRPLLTGAGRFYGRMFRMVLVAAIPLGLAGAAISVVAKLTDASVAKAVTEVAAASQVRWAIGVGIVIFFLAQLTLDAGRARIAARPERKSAFLAWLAGAWLVVRHPVHSIAIGLAGVVAGPVAALAVMALRERLPAGPGWSLVATVLLAQVAAAAVGWGRAVRVAGLARLARDLQAFRDRPADRTKNAPATDTASPSAA
ncbi:MAG: hypothetical protein WB493_03885 [Anaeromyxobacteraceae bacterium]